VFVVDLVGGSLSGATLLIAHGFPTSSFEWSSVIDLLAPHFARVVVFDYVGFGFSDKPVLDSGVYSVPDHADTLSFVASKLIKNNNIELLCHDMSDSICSELISRNVISFQRVTFLNGGMRYRLANLRLSQHILLSPLGKYFGKLPIEAFFKKQIRTLFHNQSALSEGELENWYTLMMFNYGLENMHRLIEYIRDR
jgi:pimeloyl-ACP methyl ester carboxylesterase